MTVLRRQAVGWLAWAAVARLGHDAIRVVSRLVLARLLWPEAFGVFALAYTAMDGVRMLCQLQFHPALVQRRSLDASVLSTAVWSQVVLGAAGSLVLAGAARPWAAFMGAPAVAPVALALSLHVALDGFAVVPRAWLVRELRFRELSNCSLLAALAGLVAGLGAAAAGLGIWSLVAHDLTTVLLEVGLLWARVPWRPGWHWRREHFLELLRFGGPLLGRIGFDYVARYGDRLLVGRAFGPGVLGLYSLALRVAESVTEAIAQVFARVAFAAFARVQDDPERARRGFLEATRFYALGAVPPVVATVFLAGDLIALVLGPAWQGAAPLTPLLVVRAALAALVALPRAALMGLGRQWLVVALSGAAALVYATGWSGGAPWGPAGIAAGGAVAAGALVLIALRLLALELPVAITAWGRALLPALVAGAAMAAVVAAVLHGVPEVARLGPAGRVASAVAAGGLAYAAVAVALMGARLREYLRLTAAADGRPGVP